mmetsp:Transcript_61513/g.102355  ORF Transcript_61513/g.102355 Transcript_61513/m.102355 type:complete len:231 (+) Transcript_61513:73-765(+)
MVWAKETAFEALTRSYGSDKMHRAHKYSDVYAALFDDKRYLFRNITEAGVKYGASLHVWLDYFPDAHVWGLDVLDEYDAKRFKLMATNRLHRLSCCESVDAISKTGLAKGSMDLVIEDAGDHSLALQSMLFPQLWPLVKPGGWYVIEDVDTQRDGLNYTQNHNSLASPLREILEQHHAFMVDATPGITPERWRRWQHAMRWPNPVDGKPWVASRALHNSHLLIIRRRHMT